MLEKIFIGIGITIGIELFILIQLCMIDILKAYFH